VSVVDDVVGGDGGGVVVPVLLLEVSAFDVVDDVISCGVDVVEDELEDDALPVVSGAGGGVLATPVTGLMLSTTTRSGHTDVEVAPV
jgi:hypothetical protein